MTNERVVKVTPGGEIDRLLDAALGTSVVLERAGVRYRVRIEPEKFENWPLVDPEEVERVLSEVAGSWRDIDAEAAIDEIYRRREAGSRPPGEPPRFCDER
jgi:hypothetical protein